MAKPAQKPTELTVVGGSSLTTQGTYQKPSPIDPAGLISATSATTVCRYLIVDKNRRMTETDVAEAVIDAPVQDARAFMSQLPTIFQAAVVSAGIGGSDEAVILPLIRRPEDVATVITVDSCLCRHFKGEDGLSTMLLDGLADEEGEAPAWRKATIKTPKGEDQVVPIVVDPHRALIYLRTIAETKDKKWQQEVLDNLGPEILAFIICHYYKGTLEEFNEEDWVDFRDSLEDVWEDAKQIAEQAQFDPETVESDIIDGHAATLRAIFTLPEDLIGAITGSSDELADDLDG